MGDHESVTLTAVQFCTTAALPRGSMKVSQLATAQFISAVASFCATDPQPACNATWLEILRLFVHEHAEESPVLAH